MYVDFDFCWKQIKNGEEQALEKVYKAAFRSLACYAKEITGQPQLAEEVVQDVFLKIWESRSELVIKGSFKAYLFRTVVKASQGFTVDENHLLLPIPQNERDVNKNLTQNPGY